MAVTVTKTKAKAVKKETEKVCGVTAQSMLAEKADELGVLHNQLAIAKKNVDALDKEYKKILDPIIKQIDKELSADEGVTGGGVDYVATIGAKALKANIKDVKKAYNYMKAAGGVELLVKTLKFNITDIRNYLTSSEVNEVLEEEKAGPRKVTFTNK